MATGTGSDRWRRRRRAEPSTAWDLVAAPALCLGIINQLIGKEENDVGDGSENERDVKTA